jgi:HAE1 family hydrophobic/amphiphilic exporter-1
VGDVALVGGREPELELYVDVPALSAYRLAIPDVQKAISSQFVRSAGGELKGGLNGSVAVGVRIDAQSAAQAQESLDRLLALPVTGSDGFTVELGRVARVAYDGQEPTTAYRVNGKPAVGIWVSRQTDANIVATVEGLKPLVEQLAASSAVPSPLKLEWVLDKTHAVHTSVESVEHELLMAALICGIVLFFFLHDLTSTLIVLIAIPLSLLVATIAMWLLDLTLNSMTLVGMATAIGVLVDDSIVVLENIHRHLERGESSVDAALNGRSEIGMAAIAITLVDCAVWGPIIFVSGTTGAYLRSFAIVMVAAVLASLLVSFCVTPLLASRWLRGGARDEGRGASELPRRSPLVPHLSSLARIWEPAFRLLERGYARTLRWSLRHRPVILLGAALAFAANLALVPRIGTEFVPADDGNTVDIVAELPVGTTLATTERIVSIWERVFTDATYFPDVHAASVGIGQGDPAHTDPRFIAATFEIGSKGTRTRSAREVGEAVCRAGRQLFPFMACFVSAGARGQDLQLRILGDDVGELTRLATQAEAGLAQMPELVNVTNLARTGPQAVVLPNQSRLQDLGVSSQQVAEVVQVALTGTTIGTWVSPSGVERDLRLRLPESFGSNPRAIAQVPLGWRSEMPIALAQVASVQVEQAPTVIQRYGQVRFAALGASPAPGLPLGTATKAGARVMDGLGLPPGYAWNTGGSADEQATSFRELALALLAAVLVEYLILTILYENWVYPLVVQTALPLATIGALLGLLAFGQYLNVPAFIGMVALFGLVGKNAILLVDRINQLRHQGQSRLDAIQQAGPDRLRPIVMTSAVLIFSMLPIALGHGDGSESRAPLAAVLVGGMLLSTLLSLLYVPVAYTYLDSIGAFIGRLFAGPRTRVEEAAQPVSPAPAEGRA